MAQAFLKVVVLLAALFAMSACGGSKFREYNGETVTRVEVHKAARKMYLLHETKILKEYDIKLGGNPVGPKQFEGDRKTPEGAYLITHRNPRSAFHLSLSLIHI